MILKQVSTRAFGRDYASTLEEWRHTFWKKWPTIKPLGFDETLSNGSGNFYFHYCEAGFKAGSIDVRQNSPSKRPDAFPPVQWRFGHLRPASNTARRTNATAIFVLFRFFYAESLGLSLAALGLTLFLVRLFDAVNDPIFGWMIDKTRPAFGRRRFWFAVSIPVVTLGVWKLFWPPVDASVHYVGLWTLILSIGLHLRHPALHRLGSRVTNDIH